MNKTAVQQLIDSIELRLSIFTNDEDNMSPSERGMYDAYYNCLRAAKNNLAIEKQQIIDAWEDGFDAIIQELTTGESYYNSKYKTHLTFPLKKGVYTYKMDRTFSPHEL